MKIEMVDTDILKHYKHIIIDKIRQRISNQLQAKVTDFTICFDYVKGNVYVFINDVLYDFETPDTFFSLIEKKVKDYYDIDRLDMVEIITDKKKLCLKVYYELKDCKITKTIKL